MNEAVVQFTSPDQNGFVPDGFIAENILRLQLLRAKVEEEDEKFKEILAEQESRVVDEIYSILKAINTKYAEESWVLGQIFDHEMTSEKPPSLTPPPFQVPKKRKREKLKEKLRVFGLKKQKLRLASRI